MQNSRNSIHDTGEHLTKRTRLSEKHITDECVEENTNSLYCSADEETIGSGNEWDWIEYLSSHRNSDGNFEP